MATKHIALANLPVLQCHFAFGMLETINRFQVERLRAEQLEA